LPGDDMRNRVLGFTLTLGFLAGPLAAEAQPAAKRDRLGYLTVAPPTKSALGIRVYQTFVDGLRERGWVNLKTVEALGLTVPPSVLTRVNEVIE
jgi:hypothetical protein